MASEPTHRAPPEPAPVGHVRLDPLPTRPRRPRRRRRAERADRPERTYRRAALISTAIAVPVAIMVALAFTVGDNAHTSSTAGSAPAELPALSVPAIPANPAAQAACTKVFAQLPVTLNGRSPRAVRSPSTFVVAWGQPPVILSCGVPRPAELSKGSDAFVLDTGVQWLPVQAKDGSTTLTSIDRSVYIRVLIPRASDVLPALSSAIARALPATCQAAPNPYPTNPAPDLEQTLCVNRR